MSGPAWIWRGCAPGPNVPWARKRLSTLWIHVLITLKVTNVSVDGLTPGERPGKTTPVPPRTPPPLSTRGGCGERSHPRASSRVERRGLVDNKGPLPSDAPARDSPGRTPRGGKCGQRTLFSTAVHIWTARRGCPLVHGSTTYFNHPYLLKRRDKSRGEVRLPCSGWYAILYHRMTGWHRPPVYRASRSFLDRTYLSVRPRLNP